LVELWSLPLIVFLISRQDQIVALAARYAVPAMYPLSQYVEAGGLMSYGANLPNAFLQTTASRDYSRLSCDVWGCAPRA
jgi:hypothetical protein